MIRCLFSGTRSGHHKNISDPAARTQSTRESGNQYILGMDPIQYSGQILHSSFSSHTAAEKTDRTTQFLRLPVMIGDNLTFYRTGRTSRDESGNFFSHRRNNQNFRISHRTHGLIMLIDRKLSILSALTTKKYSLGDLKVFYPENLSRPFAPFAVKKTRGMAHHPGMSGHEWRGLTTKNAKSTKRKDFRARINEQRFAKLNHCI